MQEFLLKQIENKKISHAYLFIGPKVERDVLIRKFADLLAISPVDLIWLETEDKTIKIEQIRHIINKVYLTPHSSPYKMIVFASASDLTPEASNALLKTLEEPSPNSIIILGSSSEDSLLSTIVSRCQRVKLAKQGSAVVETGLVINPLDEIKNMSFKQRFDFAARLVEDNASYSFLDQALQYYHQEITHGAGHIKILKKIYKTQKILKTSVNPRLALENLFLAIEE